MSFETESDAGQSASGDVWPSLRHRLDQNRKMMHCIANEMLTRITDFGGTGKSARLRDLSVPLPDSSSFGLALNPQ